MLTFCHGTDLIPLADHLIKTLNRNPVGHPLDQEIIVVQNHGIGQWLSLRMAKQNGIAANLKYEFPSERIWDLIRLLDDQIPQSLPSDRRPLAWSLMDLLWQKEDSLHLSQLSAYWQEEDPVQQEVRRWKLAEKLADVFDQYLVYRPQMLIQWEQGQRRYPESEAEEWQMLIWQKLLQRWKEGEHHKYLHRAKLQMQMMQALDNGTLSGNNLPERITVFGVSEMSPAFLETMVKLSRQTQVYFYYRSVDPDITSPEDFSNPLLKSLSAAGSDFHATFSRILKDNSSVASKMKWKTVDSSRSGAETVFQNVQHDLRKDRLPNTTSKTISDRSMQVHSCHSPMREVEVLYDQLLDLMESDPELNPEEVLIMTPDMETYAPLIDAAFASPGKGRPNIPYSIADRAVGKPFPAVEAFLKVLKLAQSRFKVTEVVDLLDSPPIREAFSFAEDDINKIEKWIRDNRIRWGIDGEFRRKMGAPKQENFSWKAGMDRMMLGYVMKQDAQQLHEAVYPYEEIETSDDAALAGRLSRFLHILFSVSELAEEPKTPEEWCDKLMTLVDRFLPGNRDYFRQVTSIRKALENIKENAALGAYTKPLPFRIVLNRLNDQLSNRSTGGGQIGRGVTFSSLMPMRSIPFSMIGMIGMNEESFPRTNIPIEFDLMYLRPQAGDPKRSELDRDLFLENLLSARTHIYFSYVGQSNRQDGYFPSSVVIREFIDYLTRHYGMEKGSLVTEHPLQSFSQKYFLESNPLFSYSASRKEISSQLERPAGPRKFMSTDLPEPGEKYQSLSVKELILFFQHPAKYTLRNRLGINLSEEEVLTEDREPFVLNSLDGYHLGQELFERYINGESTKRYLPVAKARDLLPAGWSGKREFAEKLREVEMVASSVEEALRQTRLDDCKVDLKLGRFRLVGKLYDIYEEELIRYRFGRCRSKDLLGWWISHLVFQLVKPEGHPGRSRFISKKSGKNRAEEQSLNPVIDAEQRLNSLLELYWQGLKRDICFYPETSYKYAVNILEYNKNERKARKAAVRSWTKEKRYHYGPGEGEEPYNMLMMSREDILNSPPFKENAITVWKPFFNAKTQ